MSESSVKHIDTLAKKAKNEKCKKSTGELYTEIWKKLLPYSRSLCKGNLQDAEDLLSHSILKCLSKIEKWKGEGSFLGWATVILKREFLSKVRSEKEHIPERFPEKSYEELFEEKLDSEIVITTAKRLPVGYKRAFFLRIKGFSHAEIAKKLGCEESTSRTQFLKARKAIVGAVKDRTC